MLKTQRMGNSRGLSFKNRLLWPTYCKVLQGHFACVIKLTSLLVEGHRSSGLRLMEIATTVSLPAFYFFLLLFLGTWFSPPLLLHKDVFCSSWTFLKKKKMQNFMWLLFCLTIMLWILQKFIFFFDNLLYQSCFYST